MTRQDNKRLLTTPKLQELADQDIALTFMASGTLLMDERVCQATSFKRDIEDPSNVFWRLEGARQATAYTDRFINGVMYKPSERLFVLRRFDWSGPETIGGVSLLKSLGRCSGTANLLAVKRDFSIQMVYVSEGCVTIFPVKFDVTSLALFVDRGRSIEQLLDWKDTVSSQSEVESSSVLRGMLKQPPNVEFFDRLSSHHLRLSAVYSRIRRRLLQ